MDPIATLITTADVSPKVYAAYLRDFIQEVTAIDWEFYDKYAKRYTLPSGMYGDSAVTGDTGGDAMRAAGLYDGTTDGFKIRGWDDIGYMMNYGFTVDGYNDADYAADGGLDFNFSDTEIPEGQAYAAGTDYRAHDKAVTNKFYINMPIVRHGATTKYDNLALVLMATEDNREIVKQFGKMGKVGQAQYVRATLINMATQYAGFTFTDGGTTAELDAFATELSVIKQALKLKGAKKFAADVKASAGNGTVPVRGGFIAIISSQMENVIQALPGFVHYTQYGTQAGLLPNEFGTIPETEIRFVTNDILIRQSATSAIGVVDTMTGQVLTGYNMIVMGKDAYGVATIAGKERYKLYIDEPGKGQDTLRTEKNMGWKTIYGCAVIRPAHIFNLPITLVTT